MINCYQCEKAKKVLTYFASFPATTTTSKKGEPAVLCKGCIRELRAARFQEIAQAEEYEKFIEAQNHQPQLVLAEVETNGIVFSDGTYNLFPTTTTTTK